MARGGDDDVAEVGNGVGWLLHAGDAYFHRGEVHADEPPCPAAWRAFQRLVQVDGATRLHNQARLRELAETHQEVRVFCAHDAVELERLANASRGATSA